MTNIGQGMEGGIKEGKSEDESVTHQDNGSRGL
jgi:hypothetical protein